MNPHLVYQVSTALSDWANYNKINGLSSWSAHDFAGDAEKFVFTLERSVEWHEQTKKTPTEHSYRHDVAEYLKWSINEKDHRAAIDVCLFEVGPNLTGLEFDCE